MGLQEQQNFLAKLYTDPGFSADFISDPSAIRSRSGLTPDEAKVIAEIPASEIQTFADSLLWKRLHGVEKLLPITARVLGREFQDHFRRFAAGYNPTSVRKHLDDAVEFCKFLLRAPGITGQARDAAKFEKAKLQFFGGNRRLAYVVLRHELTEPYARRLSLTVWVRFRGNVYRLGR